MKNIKYFLILLLLLCPFFGFAQTGKHNGEVKNLSYEIKYLNSLGTTIVNQYGIYFYPYWPYLPSHMNEILPEVYFGQYPLYFAGWELPFCVSVKNNSQRIYRNILVETFQEFLNIEGGRGEQMGSQNAHSWIVDKLGPNSEIEKCATFQIPNDGSSGIDQTHLRVSHYMPLRMEMGQIILEDFQAGLWCPL